MTRRKFNAAAWIDAVEAIPGITVWLSRALRKDPGPELKLHYLEMSDEMTAERRRQFNELRAQMRAANGIAAVEAELRRRGKIVGPSHIERDQRAPSGDLG